mgnify:CR=1 FL=1
MAVLNKFRNFLFAIMFQLTTADKEYRMNTYKTFYIRFVRSPKLFLWNAQWPSGFPGSTEK